MMNYTKNPIMRMPWILIYFKSPATRTRLLNGRYGEEITMVEYKSNELTSFQIPEIFKINDVLSIQEIIVYLDNSYQPIDYGDLLFSKGGYNTNEEDNEISILEIVAKSLARYRGEFPSDNRYAFEINRKLLKLFDYPQTDDMRIIDDSDAVKRIMKSKYLKYFIREIVSIVEGVPLVEKYYSNFLIILILVSQN